MQAIIYQLVDKTLGAEIDPMKRSLRSLTSIIKNTKSIRSTRTRRSTKSITLRSQKRGKVQKSAKGPKRESRARTEVKEDIIIEARETCNHLGATICSLPLPHLTGAKDILLEISRAMAALTFHQIEGTEVMSLEVDFLHNINHNLPLTNMEEHNMKRIKIETTITTIKVGVLMRAADSVAEILNNNSRMNRQRSLVDSLISVSQF